MPETSGNRPTTDRSIVITGAGGFIAGSLVRHFHDRGFTRIRAVDKKPLATGTSGSPAWSACAST